MRVVVNTGNSTVINGNNIVGNNVVVANGRVYVDGIEQFPREGEAALPIEIHGTVGGLTVNGSNMNVSIKGNVHGSVTSEGSVDCGNVNCDVRSGGSVNCDNVGGSVFAGGSVNCDDVGGSVSAGGSVRHS